MYSQHNNQSIIANKDLKAWVKILNTSSADAEKIMNAWMTNGTLAEVFAQAKQEKIPFLTKWLEYIIDFHYGRPEVSEFGRAGERERIQNCTEQRFISDNYVTVYGESLPSFYYRDGETVIERDDYNAFEKVYWIEKRIASRMATLLNQVLDLAPIGTFDHEFPKSFFSYFTNSQLAQLLSLREYDLIQKILSKMSPQIAIRELNAGVISSFRQDLMRDLPRTQAIITFADQLNGSSSSSSNPHSAYIDKPEPKQNTLKADDNFLDQAKTGQETPPPYAEPILVPYSVIPGASAPPAEDEEQERKVPVPAPSASTSTSAPILHSPQHQSLPAFDISMEEIEGLHIDDSEDEDEIVEPAKIEKGKRKAAQFG